MLQVRRRGRSERRADERRHAEWAPLPGESPAAAGANEAATREAVPAGMPVVMPADIAPLESAGAGSPPPASASRAAPAEAALELVSVAGDVPGPAAAPDEAPAAVGPGPAVAIPVELIAPHLRAQGVVRMRGFERLSDMVNLADELTVEDVALLDTRGRPLSVRLERLRVNRNLVCLLAQRRTPSAPNLRHSFYVHKHATRVIVLAQHHLVIGDAHVPEGGSVATYMESTDPRFMPLTCARVRLLSDTRHAARFDLVLLNRREILGWSALPGDGETLEAWETFSLGLDAIAAGAEEPREGAAAASIA